MNSLMLMQVDAGRIEETGDPAIVMTFEDIGQKRFEFQVVGQDQISKFESLFGQAAIAIRELEKGNIQGSVKKKI